MSIFKKSDLDKWFNEEKWVDVSRPKKDGGFEECGRSNADKGKYPVCTPASKARTLDEKERKNRIKAKRKNEKKKRKGKSPHMTNYTPTQGGKSNPKTASKNLVENLVKSKGIKIETTFLNCLRMYDEYFFDLKGSWDFDDLLTPKMIEKLLPREVLNLPVIIDGKHVVIDIPDTGVEVFNMIPEHLIDTTMR
jgi:hypothetical protein